RADRRAGGASGDTSDVLPSRLFPGCGHVKFRKQPDGYVSPSRNLHGPRSQRRKTRRPAGDAGHQVRVGHQPKDREGTRPRNPTDAACPSRRGDRMKRRDFITLLGGAAVAWPLVARAQQAGLPVVGVLLPTSLDTNAGRLRAFRGGLKDAGYVEGENLAIEYRSAEGHNDQLSVLAADLVRRQVAVIASPVGTPSALAAKAATMTIPIVFGVAEDPVKLGLVASLARPGGNLTGINYFNVELVAKRLEFLRDLVPAATRVAVLVNPASAANTEATLRDVQSAAGAMGVQIQVLNASTSREIEAAFATFVRERADAL